MRTFSITLCVAGTLAFSRWWCWFVPTDTFAGRSYIASIVITFTAICILYTLIRPLSMPSVSLRSLSRFFLIFDVSMALCLRIVCFSVSVCAWLKFVNIVSYKGLANAKRPCDCSVLCLHPKSSLCSCLHYILDLTDGSLWWIFRVEGDNSQQPQFEWKD